MLHHVAVEVRPEQMEAEGEFWKAVGFREVTAPESLGQGYSWYENGGSQVHLMRTIDPATPPRGGHIAIVAADMEVTVARLEVGGHSWTEARQLWGKRRIKATTPAGHVVEVMAAPPIAAR